MRAKILFKFILTKM